MVNVEHLVALVEPFRQACLASGRRMSVTHLSALLFNDGKRLPKMIDGRSDIGSRKLAEAFRWFSDNWPEGADWPADVPRPAPIKGTDELADVRRPTPAEEAA